MKSVIVGTAGHIDHGKTALVKALTGIEADRLEEEKRRGITIDLGFAHLELPGPGGETLKLGFVDVPGHEKFVRNMLAGVGGIDLVLFVIAADESIKPQTREHFEICRLLAIPHGITVLTKADLVDAETLAVVRSEVEEFVRGSFLDTAQSPIVPVSALTGVGISDLKRALAESASHARTRSSVELTRLPIDRVFTMKGFGTVVTGTLISGKVRKEDELEIFPSGHRVRVRGIQVHGRGAEQAIAGERTALNLTGISKEDLARGMVAAPPETFSSTSFLDVALSLLPGAKPLKDRARVHFHAYSFETTAEVVLHEANTLRPGETGLARLKLKDPALLLPGDRFIFRQFSPVITIGGGQVLDAFPEPKTKKEPLLNFLNLLRSGEPATILKTRIVQHAIHGVSIAQLVRETGWRKEAIGQHLTKAINAGDIIRVGEVLIHSTPFDDVKAFLMKAVADFHQDNPLAPGIQRESLRESLALNQLVFNHMVETLVREKKLDSHSDLLKIAGRSVVMKDEEAEARKIIESVFFSAGLKVPALKEVVASLKVDKVRAEKIITLMLRDKVLVKVSAEMVFHRSALEDLRKLLAAEKAKSNLLDVARFKDLTGVSRKYAIPLLEYLDREKVTRRQGDTRILV